VDVLYEFSHFNFSKLNADVLGTIYEEYVDRVDRKNKGQYYTPREVVSFIWDLVGFNNDEAFFRFENGQRKTRLIFDPCTGSGGFLVEAARRLREDAKYNDGDFKDLSDIENCIINGLSGSEISPFAYYITEINLLIQLTPIIKEILNSHKYLYRHPQFALSVIHQDSLKLHNNEKQITIDIVDFQGNDIRENEKYVSDKRHDIVSLEGQKRQVYDFIKNCQEFDYICANPPYIGEKGHKELFRSTIKQFPYWKDFYQGKMDYLYWFIILGLSKLKEGGKLGFITTSYWSTADGAVKLRKFILDNAKIETMVDFGETKIFEGAPGQHNLVFVLEKCGDEKKRQKNQIKVVKVKNNFDGDSVREKLRKLLNHIEKNIGKKEFLDEYIGIFVSPVKQKELNEKSWSFAESVSYDITSSIMNIGIPLVNSWSIDQGVVPNPLRLTRGKFKELSHDVIEKHNLKIGDGVFVLTKDEKDDLKLPKGERDIIKPYFKNSDINQYITSVSTNNFLVYTNSETNIDKYPTIKFYLEKFKNILSRRRECEEGKIPWFSLHWARNQKIFEGDKIVCSYRVENASFAYHKGSFYGSTDMYFIKPKDEKDPHSLKYLIAILNSKLIDFWLLKKGKIKGNVKEQFSTPLENLPIRRIDFNNLKEVKTHDKLVLLVDTIIESKKRLAAFNQFFPQARLTRLSENEPLPEIDIEAIVKSLPSSSLRILRTYSEIKYEPKAVKSFYLKGLKEDDAKTIILASKDKQQITLTAPKKILEYLKEILPAYKGKEWQDIINHVILPADLTVLENKKKKVFLEVTSLHAKITKIQHEIDEIVFELYEITRKEKEEICKISL
jgi:adenine-specific DNA-methyltransferase